MPSKTASPFPRLQRFAREKYPLLWLNLAVKPRRLFSFRNEKKAMKGADISKSEHRSIVFFSVNKSATQYVNGILKTLAENEKMMHLNYNSYFSLSNNAKYQLYSDPVFMEKAFKDKGYLYGPSGGWINIPDIGKYLVLLLLRDPRDVLTSSYFSVAYSHELINRTIVNSRQQARQMTIDEFALQRMEPVKKTYDTYCRELLSERKPNVLLMKYEDMVSNFSDWLDRIAAHLELNGNPALIQMIKDQADFTVAEQNVYSHRRQVTPGDHKRKLKAETINILNDTLHPILEKLGYD